VRPTLALCQAPHVKHWAWRTAFGGRLPVADGTSAHMPLHDLCRQARARSVGLGEIRRVVSFHRAPLAFKLRKAG